jgi:hypothetical protein
MSVDARSPAGAEVASVPVFIAGCAAATVVPESPAAAVASRACGESGGLAIAADTEPCDVARGKAGDSAGANGPSDWLHAAAARPKAAQISGWRILIMDIPTFTVPAHHLTSGGRLMR